MGYRNYTILELSKEEGKNGLKKKRERELGEEGRIKIIQDHGNKFEFCIDTKSNHSLLDNCKQEDTMISYKLLKDKFSISSSTYCVEC